MITDPSHSYRPFLAFLLRLCSTVSVRLIICTFLLSLAGQTSAQTGFYQSVTPDETDESLSIQCMAGDRYGFLWLSTRQGLYRYNGRQFQSMLPDSLTAKLSVTAICTDSLGRPWIGATDGRIYFREAQQWQRFNPEEGLPGKAITVLRFDKAQRLWIATADEGLYVYEGKRLTQFARDDGMPDNYVYDLAMLPDGAVLAGTDRGLAYLRFDQRNKKVSSYSTREGLPDNIVRAITFSGKADQYWLGLEDRGLALFDARTRQVLPVDAARDWRYGRVNALLEADGQVWAATEEGGLISLQIHDGEWSIHPVDLPGLRKPSKLHLDPQGELWMAVPGKLIRSTIRQMQFLDSIDHLALTGIHALYIAPDQTAWISQGKSIESLRNIDGRWQLGRRYTFPGLALDNITSLYQNPGGMLWIGTMGAGLLILDPRTGKWKPISDNPVIAQSHILSIAGNGGEVWISGLNGIARYRGSIGEITLDAGKFTQYGKQSGIGSDYVYQVFIDSRKRVWFCTDGAGVASMDEERIVSYDHQSGLQSTVVYGVTESPDGTLWFNTLEQGILRFDGKTFTPFFQLPGNQRGTISSIHAGKAMLTVVHKRGMECIDITSGRSVHYGRNNGVQRNQVNLNVIAEDRDGRVWIGADPGIILVEVPGGQGLGTPRTVITQLRALDQILDTGTRHRLNWDDNNISIEFDGLYYPDPDQVRFEYRLDNYHRDWLSTTDREVNFPRLPPGSYTFRLRSAIDGRLGLGEEQTLQFVIALPFWKTWWFIAGSSALAVFLISFLMRLRFRQLQQLEKLKQDKIQAELQTLRAQVNPHFLFNSFNTLIGVLEEQPEQGIAYTEKLSSFYRSMLTHREHDLLPLQEEIRMLDTYVYLQQQRFGKGLSYTCNLPEAEGRKWLIPPMTLQLLAENAIKHNTVSPETPLAIDVSLHGTHLEVSNTIHRKKTPERGEGIGLKNIRERYRLYTGKAVSVHVTQDRFVVQLPLINVL